MDFEDILRMANLDRRNSW